MMSILEELSQEMKSFIRVLKVVAMIIAVSHVFACVWHLIGVSGAPGNNWIDNYNGGSETWHDSTMESNYLVALYFSFVTVTTVGYGDILPVTDGEIGFVIFTAFVGTAVFAFILGEMQMMVGKRNVSDLEFDAKMESVTEFMAFKRFPSKLRKAVRQYYHTIWKSNIIFDEKAILSDLSPELRHESAMHLRAGVIAKVSFLRTATPVLLEHLAHRLNAEVVGKGFTVMRAGEIADCMYIIDTGEAVATSFIGNPPKERRRMLSDGMFFGELALLQDGTRRYETVRTTRTTEFMILSKKDLDVVLQEHPEAKEHLAKTNVRRGSLDAGVVSAEATEAELMHAEFMHADIDGDGVVDEEEFAMYLARGRSTNEVPASFAAADVNGDGACTGSSRPRASTRAGTTHLASFVHLACPHLRSHNRNCTRKGASTLRSSRRA